MFSFSSVSPVNHQPLAFSITRKKTHGTKDTLVNILDTGHFVVNHTVQSVFDKGYQAAYEYDPDVDEFDEVGLTAVASKYGIAPIVKESPLALECSLYKTMDIGEPKYGGSTIVVGKLLAVHISESCWKDGQIIPQTLESVSRLSAMNYGNADITFKVLNDQVWSDKHW
ncbi:uncharacterized protein aq_928-like [Ptychodera flava]|uniref:uncharacterized protein aq_928-like n=1 Tax=Ptychodera flava TaxID=63121 RepID=UPI00396A3C33